MCQNYICLSQIGQRSKLQSSKSTQPADGAPRTVLSHGTLYCSDFSHFRQRFTRKKSTDTASRRKYMDDEGDDSDDEVFAESDEDEEKNGDDHRREKESRVGGSEEDENSSGGRLSPASLPDTTSSAKNKDKSKMSR